LPNTVQMCHQIVRIVPKCGKFQPKLGHISGNIGHNDLDFCLTADTNHRINNYYSTKQCAEYTKNYKMCPNVANITVTGVMITIRLEQLHKTVDVERQTNRQTDRQKF
jgi:hypothetical protein